MLKLGCSFNRRTNGAILIASGLVPTKTRAVFLNESGIVNSTAPCWDTVQCCIQDVFQPVTRELFFLLVSVLREFGPWVHSLRHLAVSYPEPLFVRSWMARFYFAGIITVCRLIFMRPQFGTLKAFVVRLVMSVLFILRLPWHG